MVSPADITELLNQWKTGDERAMERLVPLVYQELRSIARSYLRRERRDHTLQATALVHEVFLRLAKQGLADVKDRAHFFGIAARAMRQILVAHARSHRALKRGGNVEKLRLANGLEASIRADFDLESLDSALNKLARKDAFVSRVVELRFFGGHTIKETAEILGCSPATVSREWEFARTWLYREIQGGSLGE
jgi:RNA polymerase sigma factor (TIGR02999 family)